MATHADDEKAGSIGFRPKGKGRGRKWCYLLLLMPLVGLLYPPFYNRFQPDLDGIPFFIWYQFAWVLGGAATTLIVTALTREDEP